MQILVLHLGVRNCLKSKYIYIATYTSGDHQLVNTLLRTLKISRFLNDEQHILSRPTIIDNKRRGYKRLIAINRQLRLNSTYYGVNTIICNSLAVEQSIVVGQVYAPSRYQSVLYGL